MSRKDSEIPGFTPTWNGHRLAAFRRRLLRWYDEHGRDLPWRRSRDPYRVWISEIMLQQTTVAAVVPYFERFLERFPTVVELAAADERDVLRHWEGLGYYSRARNIHKAARLLVAERDGRFPETVHELRQLPGIGRYTAGAIASFAFNEPAPIVEANTLRLYCRLLGYDGDPRTARGQKILWEFAGRIVQSHRTRGFLKSLSSQPGRLNHALMDLGATVCRGTEPDCPACPVKQHCAAFREGTVAGIPVPAKKPEITELTESAVVVRKNGRVLLRQCRPGERWAGLWDFPRFEIAVDKQAATETLTHLRERVGIEAIVHSQLDDIRHSVTRYRIRLLCFTAEFESGRVAADSGARWVPVASLDGYPLSVTGRKLAREITANRANRRE
jgi:A/G-specific adenine glycosylase